MISALERLRALRAARYPETVVINAPQDLPMAWRIEFEERAAILEYDGGLHREEADELALHEIIARLKRMEGRAGS